MVHNFSVVLPWKGIDVSFPDFGFIICPAVVFKIALSHSDRESTHLLLLHIDLDIEIRILI